MKSIQYFCSILLLSSVFGYNYEKYRSFLETQSKNGTFMKYFDKHVQRFQKPRRKAVQFPCEPFPSQKKPRNVHELTPADVQIVAAIGDSITAGTGITAQTPIGLIQEDRGLSWSVGGDGDVDEHITLPNILKRYNPTIVGFSIKSGDFESENAHLNVADPGNEARNMPFQARLLVDRMKSGKYGDFENDWKVITMFIGGNDLCDYCTDRPEYTTEKYLGHITEALDIFHKEVPKAFVNVVETINIGNVPLLNEGLICNTLHYFTCKCGAFPGSDENRKELNELVDAYQKGLRNLVASGRYDTRDDFTVVDQPFFSETKIPQNSDGSTDLDYFAPDCFHFSELGQESAASALWDNMIEPVGMKRNFWRPGEPVECPDAEQPYFYTSKNSPKSNILGAYQEPDKQNNELQNKKNNHGHPMSGSIVAGSIIGVICLLFIVSATIYYFKRRNHNIEESRPLIGMSTSYTKI